MLCEGVARRNLKETPWKYIFSERSGGEEYDKILTWSEELNIPGIWGGFWKIAESPKWDRIHTDFMESWWDHSDRFVGVMHNFEHFQS